LAITGAGQCKDHQLLLNLGSGAINVPVLRAAGKVSVQIIDIIKVGRLHILLNSMLINTSQTIKENRANCKDLVTFIVQLLDPIRETLKNQNVADIDCHLKEDLQHFTQYVVQHFHYLC
jgi:hypothetical protein